MKIQIETVYHEDEEHRKNGWDATDGDYWEINIYVDGKLARTYGDYYHDKGSEKSEAFVDGIAFAIGETPEVEHTEVCKDMYASEEDEEE